VLGVIQFRCCTGHGRVWIVCCRVGIKFDRVLVVSCKRGMLDRFMAGMPRQGW
jgi:hypothetical protein